MLDGAGGFAVLVVLAGRAIHDLRHFAGSQTARVGNVIETMGRLGHSSVGASLRYQHMVSGRDIEIADALSQLAEISKTGADIQTLSETA